MNDESEETPEEYAKKLHEISLKIIKSHMKIARQPLSEKELAAIMKRHKK